MDRDSINKHFITAKRLSTFVKDGALPIQDAAQKLYDTTLEISDKRKKVLLEEGLADYIMKPFDKEGLLSRVDIILQD